VVVQVTIHHAPEPGTDLSDGRVAAFHQAVSYRPQRRPHAGGDCHAPDADPERVQRLMLATAALSARAA
jgi:hypothetical protein